MPPHLHPRSRLTSSLFGATLFASFFVVALPHVLPCPAPRVAYADELPPRLNPDGSLQRRRRKRRCEPEPNEQAGESKDQGISEENRKTLRGKGEGLEDSGDETEGQLRKSTRECPVPKPGGMVGEILGFRSSSSGGKGSRPP